MGIFDVPAVPRVLRQPALEANLPVFTVVPKSPAVAPFDFQMTSYPNEGAGAGTFNHGVWLGWNASSYARGTPMPDRPGIYMGFEDNYFDHAGDRTFGVEWYTGYTTPDQTTIGPGALRPLYWRVVDSDSNTPDKSVAMWADIGSGGQGSFAVMGSVLTSKQLFVVTPDRVVSRVRSYFTANGGSVQVAPADGYAQFDLVAPGTGVAGHYGVIGWRDVNTPVWSVAATTGEWYVKDLVNGKRQHLSLAAGESNTTAVTTLYSNLAVKGGFGANGATPQDRAAAIAAPATQTTVYVREDVQSIADAVNKIRQALSDVGITE